MNRYFLAFLVAFMVLPSCMTLAGLEEEYPRSWVVRKWIETVHSKGSWIHSLFGDGWKEEQRSFVELRLPDGETRVVEVTRGLYEEIRVGSALIRSAP